MGRPCKERWIVFNDAHVPFQDDSAMSLMFDFIGRKRPYGIVILGDFVDFYQISRFDKDPLRANTLQTDLTKATALLAKIRKAAGSKAHIIYVAGNHEDRLRRYLWSEAPALASLESLRLPELLKLSDSGVVYQEEAKIGDLFLLHGDIVRRHSSYTAKAMYDKHGVTMMHGHTHRDGKYTKRTRGGHFAVWENYCMCNLNPDYIDFPDWTQGFSVVTVVQKRPFVEQIAIIGGKYVYNGKIWSAA